MPKFLMSALAIAAATLGSVPMAQAQMAPDHHVDRGHRGPDRNVGRPGPRGQRFIPREQSLRLRTAIGQVNTQVLQAQRARRITTGQAGGLRAQLNSLQSRFWTKMRDGMTQGEYDSVSNGIRQVRGNLQRIIAQNGRLRR